MCEDALAFSQYEQGGYLGSPDLSPAVFSTRHHRGADFVLPRHAVNSTVPLTEQGRTGVLLLSRALVARILEPPVHYALDVLAFVINNAEYGTNS